MAFGNAAAERAAIESMYEDVATVKRNETVRGANNISEYKRSIVYDNVICGISYTTADKSDQTDVQNNIDVEATLFISPELDIRPGDYITVKRFGRDNPISTLIREYEVIGPPPVYATHQEVRLKAGDLA